MTVSLPLFIRPELPTNGAHDLVTNTGAYYWMKLQGCFTTATRAALVLVRARWPVARPKASKPSMCTVSTREFSRDSQVRKGHSGLCLRFCLIERSSPGPGMDHPMRSHSCPKPLIPCRLPLGRGLFPLRCPLIGVVQSCSRWPCGSPCSVSSRKFRGRVYDWRRAARRMTSVPRQSRGRRGSMA